MVWTALSGSWVLSRCWFLVVWKPLRREAWWNGNKICCRGGRACWEKQITPHRVQPWPWIQPQATKAKDYLFFWILPFNLLVKGTSGTFFMWAVLFFAWRWCSWGVICMCKNTSWFRPPKRGCWGGIWRWGWRGGKSHSMEKKNAFNSQARWLWGGRVFWFVLLFWNKGEGSLYEHLFWILRGQISHAALSSLRRSGNWELPSSPSPPTATARSWTK